jgi:hypothetical protein
MFCKIVIPSLGRADRVLTKRVVDDPILCVRQSEAEAYALYNPELEIVSHPDDLIGLQPKRNWIRKHFGNVFMLDDDISHCQRTTALPGEIQRIDDAEAVTANIQRLCELAILMDIPLFGFTKNPRPEQYNEFQPFSLMNMITGCAHGVLENSKIFYNDNLLLKDDFYISGLCKFRLRKVLVDRRYCFVQLDTFKRSGGLAATRNLTQEKRQCLEIRRLFGEAVTIRKGTKTAGLKSRFNISMSFPF